MKYITHPQLTEVQEIDSFTNKERHFFLCNYIQNNAILDYSIPDIREDEIDLLLLEIHSEEYIKESKLKPAFIPARLYFGLIISQAKKLLSWEKVNIFCIGYPAWHHAERCWHPWEGFCFFSNIAWAAKVLSKWFKRILIVDFDVHQGNGTKNIIRWEEGVYLISLQPHWLYPLYLDKDTLQDNYLGIEYDVDDDYQIILNWIKNAVQKWSPDIILVSAWFDAHNDDPFSPTHLTEKDYEQIGLFLNTLNLPIFTVLEWGYNYEATAKSIIAFGKNL